MFKSREFFKVKDWYLGEVRFLEDDNYYWVYVGKRDLQISKKTGEVEGSGVSLYEFDKEGDIEKIARGKLRPSKRKSERHGKKKGKVRSHIKDT